MTKILKRYCLCATFLTAAVLIIYYNYLGRSRANRRQYSDEFVAVAYVNDYDVTDDAATDADNSSRLLNLTDFRYLIEPKICDNHRIDGELAILLVTSYVGHDEVRAAHRSAISAETLRNLKVARIFLLAAIPKKEKFISQNAIANENKHFNDILQGNFMESYRNLPYKHVMGLRWASKHPCLKPKFIVKMDDDIVVDFFHLVKYMNSLHLTTSHFLSGYVFRNVVPIRASQNKWFVTREEFREDIYPDYLSGWLYVTVPFTARALVVTSFAPNTQIFWIDDLWVTGVIRDICNIPINDALNEMFSANSQFIDCCIDDIEKHQYHCPFIAGPDGGDHRLIKRFVHAIFNKCYDRRTNLMVRKCLDRPTNKGRLKDTCVGADKHLLKQSHGAAIVKPVNL